MQALAMRVCYDSALLLAAERWTVSIKRDYVTAELAEALFRSD